MRPTLLLMLAGAVAAAGGRADAYPYPGLRPADQVIGGPTDGYLSSMHYNPAGMRLFGGSQLLVVAGARGYIGSYGRSAPLPAGFAPNASGGAADPQSIGWATSDMMIAGSWDLRTDTVAMGFALYTPYNDETAYADRDTIAAQGPGLERTTTRYHAVADRTYNLWGTVSFGLRIRPWLYIGGGFQFAYTHRHLTFMRDLDPNAGDWLACAGVGPCEQWANRLLLDLDVSGWGYGFTSGVLVEPIDNRLWLGASYISPLFTSAGAEVGLDGQPQRQPWVTINASQPCGAGGTGVRVTRGSQPTDCGAAHVAQSFPHTIYLGVRGRIPLPAASTAVVDEISADSEVEPRLAPNHLAPTAIELTSWARLVVPPREYLLLTLDQRVYGPGLLSLPTDQRTAIAIAVGIRELWPRLILAQELLYESPRTDPASVSPANLDGHKLDFSVAARLRVQRWLWLVLSGGVTGYIFSGPGLADAGSAFSTDYAAACRASSYDINTLACQQVQNGFDLPSAVGTYSLIVPHGAAGVELKF